MRKLGGKCECDGTLDFRQVDVKKEEDQPSSEVIGWIIVGICGVCKRVYAQMFHNEKIPPTQGIDFEIDWSGVPEVTDAKIPRGANESSTN